MNCPRCNSERVAEVASKSDDQCTWYLGRAGVEGVIPSGLGVADAGYIEFKYCLDCGQILGNFPIPEKNVREALGDE